MKNWFDNSSHRDWYKRKLNKEMQKYFDDLCDSQRFTKKDEKAPTKERQSNKQIQLNLKTADFIGNCANYIIQGDLGVFCTKFAGTIIFFDNHKEHVYMKVNATDIDADDSIYYGVADALAQADKFTEELWYKGKKVNIPRAVWVDSPDSRFGPQLDFRDGGFADRGSYRYVDCIDALILRNEFVISRKAMRGLGKGSYKLAAEILYQLMRQWEREAKNYAHKR